MAKLTGKRLVFIIIAAVVVIAAAAVITYNLMPAPVKKVPISTPHTVTLHDHNSAKDGDVTFTLSTYTCGLARIGNDAAYSDANGQYCTASVQVKNTSSSVLQLTSQEQTAVTTDNKSYKADAVALYYVGNDSWYDAIEPKTVSSGKFVFELPRGAQLHKFVFHADVKTDGAAITLP